MAVQCQASSLLGSLEILGPGGGCSRREEMVESGGAGKQTGSPPVTQYPSSGICNVQLREAIP